MRTGGIRRFAQVFWAGLSLFLVGSAMASQVPAVRADDPLVVIVHPKGPASRMSARELYDVFTSERNTWPDGSRILVLNLPAHNETRERFDRAVMQRDPEGVAKFWIDRRVRGGAPPPKTIPSVQLVLRVVETAEGAIGYVPASMVSGHAVRVVAKISGTEVTAP